MNAVKHSYEDEVRLLDAEVAELRAKQRQANSYIMELRKRFEENMRSIYRYVHLYVHNFFSFERKNLWKRGLLI